MWSQIFARVASYGCQKFSRYVFKGTRSMNLSKTFGKNQPPQQVSESTLKWSVFSLSIYCVLFCPQYPWRSMNLSKTFGRFRGKNQPPQQISETTFKWSVFLYFAFCFVNKTLGDLEMCSNMYFTQKRTVFIALKGLLFYAYMKTIKKNMYFFLFESIHVSC